MRLAPPVVAPLWREMRMQEFIAGNVLTKGTDVATCIYAIHRNPTYFSKPNEFIPERWLSENQSEQALKLARRAFVPFSLGSRGCLGKNIAYMELTTALAQVMFRADWKSAEGPLGKVGEERLENRETVDFGLEGHFTSHKHGPYIQFAPRKLEH
jgi:cytochrome P450